MNAKLTKAEETLHHIVVVTFKYEEDMVSTKMLVEAAAESEGGILYREHKDFMWKPYTDEQIPTVKLDYDFATMYHACWFMAKMATMDFVYYIDARLDGPAKHHVYTVDSIESKGE